MSSRLIALAMVGNLFRSRVRRPAIVLLALSVGIMVAIQAGGIERIWNSSRWSTRAIQSILRSDPATLRPAPPEFRHKAAFEAQLELVRSDPEKAIAILLPWVRDHADDPMSRVILGDAFRLAGNMDQAVAEWQEVGSIERIGRAGWEALAEGRWDDAQLAFCAVWELDPAAGTFGLANALQARGDTSGAEVLLRQSLDSMPATSESSKWQLLLGEMLEHEGRWFEATDAYEQAVARVPDNPGAHIALGRALYHLGDVVGGTNETKKGIALAPGNSAGYSALADLLSHEKRYTEADALYVKALSLSPDDAWLWMRRANNAMAANNFAQAVALFREVTGRFGARVGSKDLAAANCSLAGAYLQLMDRDQALAAIEDSLALDSSKAGCWATEGNIREALGDRAKALESYEHALSLDPENSSAQQGLKRTRQ